MAIERANYPHEQYAKAFEAMAKDLQLEIEHIRDDEDPFEYARNVTAIRTRNQSTQHLCETAAQILRGTPMSLYTVWPDYFPDPRGANDDKE